MQKFVSLILTLLFLTSCQEKVIYQTVNKPSEGIRSENIESSSGVWIKKEFIGKRLIWSRSAIQGAPSATGNNLSAFLVKFQINNNSLLILQDFEGLLETRSILPKAILAKFPILKKSSEGVLVDWDKGLTHLVYERPMGSSESAPSKPGYYPINQSWVDISKTENGGLFIKQLVNITSKGPKGQEEMGGMTLKHHFKPYNPNPQFTSVISNGQKRVGFFEALPIFEAGKGTKIINILKWSLEAPITYYLSANTPAKYRQAVSDGILYWNRVFGKEVLKVGLLPADVEVHDPGYNIVQWMDWDSSGFAYANIYGDPLTGETQQAHVYMTSVFGNSAYLSAGRLLERIIPTRAPSIMGLAHMGTCQHKDFQSPKDTFDLIHTFENLENDFKADPEEIKTRFAMDYVRQVVAHEVGHTLGLRHNFIGNETTNINSDNYSTILEEYLLNDYLPADLMPASTVMDYVPTTIASLTGAYIRQQRLALPYDQAAIQWAYYQNQTVDKIPAFCTDNNKGKYIDCGAWSRFSQPVKTLKLDFKKLSKNLTRRLKGNLKSFGDNQYKLRPKTDLNLIQEYYFKPWLKSISHNAQYYFIRHQFPDKMNWEEQMNYQDELYRYVESGIKEVGGLISVMQDYIWPHENQRIALVKNMADDVFQSFPNMSKDNEDYLNRYFDYLERKILDTWLVALNQNKFMVHEEGVEKVYYQWLLAYLTKVLPSPFVLGQINKTEQNNFNAEWRLLLERGYSPILYPGSTQHAVNMRTGKQKILAFFQARRDAYTAIGSDVYGNAFLFDMYGFENKMLTLLKR